MTEAIAIGGLVLSVVVGIIRETQFKRQRGDKISAETSVDEATAANTITETVKGLLVVMDLKLAAAELKVEEIQKLLVQTRLMAEQREDELRAEIDTLKAKVSVLIEAEGRKNQ